MHTFYKSLNCLALLFITVCSLSLNLLLVLFRANLSACLGLCCVLLSLNLRLVLLGNGKTALFEDAPGVVRSTSYLKQF